MGKFNMDSKIKDVIANEEAVKIMESYIPGCSTNPQLGLVKGLKIKSLVGKGHYVGLTPEQEKEALNKIMAIE